MALFEGYERRIFLTERAAGAGGFPSGDAAERLVIELYFTDETTLFLSGLGDVSEETLRPLAEEWFFTLSAVSWIKTLADGGDALPQAWENRTAFAKDDAPFSAALAENERAFAVMAAERFEAEDEAAAKRMELASRQGELLVDASVSALLEEENPAAYVSDAGGDKKYQTACFIVRRIVKALSMPEPDLSLPGNITKRMDSLGLIRRLFRKGNIEMRMISLTEGWQETDSGVMLGY